MKVRQALAMAINKPAIIDAVFQGTGTAAKTCCRRSMGADSELRVTGHDPEKPKRC